MPRVVVLGSSNTDMTVRLPRLPSPGQTVLGGEFLVSPGGKGANQAVAARRAGADVLLLSAVGDDDLGLTALARYRSEGIDVGHVREIAGAASGVALIFVGDGGENMIGVAPGANGWLIPSDIDALPDTVFDPAAVLLASLEVPYETALQALRRAKAAGMTTVLNPAPADARLAHGEATRLADVLTPNLSEAASLTNLLHERERLNGAVVVTMGDRGCVVARDDEFFHVPAFPAEAVDTVGAGDAFNGALAVALAEGRPLLEAASWACAAAALAVSKPGAQDALPRREAIDRLADTRSERPSRLVPTPGELPWPTVAAPPPS